ncbi:fimbrial protein [Kosakonia sp. BYX6]|uniref:Fimbrial protein n=1 Tax=Kosakonia calanthes TaxID=3139408 RepID=A0ABZ3B4F5_9ENTR
MFRMKSFCTAATIFALGLSSSAFAATANNTVRFMGEVSEQTCNIDIDGNSTSPVVLLPTVSNSQLASSGSTAGDTPFTVTLSGCGPQLTSAGIVFVANNIDGQNLKNTATTAPATNVAIQLLEGTTELNFVNNKVETAKQSVGGSNLSATYDLTARYFATGVATAGNVEAQAQFAVTYL